jgi:hypothetical protein
MGKTQRYAALGLVSAVAESELASIEKKNKEKKIPAGSAAFDAFNPIIEKSSAYNMALKIFSNKEVAPKSCRLRAESTLSAKTNKAPIIRRIKWSNFPIF